MTSTIHRGPAAPGPRPEWRGTHPDGHKELSELLTRLPVVWLIALAAVCLRMPLLGRPPTPDEAGFLLVGGQWHAGGTSLYGDYWVDRPPLLITIFRLASETGGLIPLRLIGCAAAVLTILGVAHLARRLGGAHAATWSALTAAALLVSPLTGAMAVNGELLAAPLVIWGIVAMVHALRVPHHAALMAAAAGGALVCSLLIKQNFVDVAVFSVAAVVIALWRRELTPSRAAPLLGGFGLGAATALVAVSIWTMLHGTSLAGVYDAMIPFRVEAERVLASSANHGSRSRLWALLISWFICGGAALMVLIAAVVTRRRLVGTAVWALTTTVAFETASVLLGGSYWNHYLVQLVAPLAVLVGVAAARAFTGMRPVVVATVVVAGVAWTIALPWQHASPAQAVGTSIASVAGPDDTIVTLYGHSEVTRASGLASPYPYLWSLPTKTRDPDLLLLAQVMTGPHAPTWFVTWRRISSWGVDSTAAARALAARYHPVARPDGHTIYLLDDAHRSTPEVTGPLPSTPPLITTFLKELLP